MIQIAFGIGRLGKFIRMVPHSVMLALSMASRLSSSSPSLVRSRTPDGAWLATAPLLWMLGLAILTMAVIAIMPRLTKAIPAPLIGIAVTSALVLGIGIDTTLLKDMPGWELGQLAFLERLPMPHWPGYDAATLLPPRLRLGIDLPSVWSPTALLVCLPFAVVLAAVGLIESLMTMSVIDEITETRGPW